MSKPIVLDIETKNTFQDVGAYEPTLLDVSLVGIYDYLNDAYTSYLGDELDQLWPRLEKSSLIIGFNSNHFDLPILNKYYAGDLLKLPSLDLLAVIKDVLGKGVRLEDVAKATLGYGKTGDGMLAINLWKAQKLEELKKYCLADVKITKELYEYGKEQGFIKYTTPLGVKQLKVNFNFFANNNNKINFTLPI